MRQTGRTSRIVDYAIDQIFSCGNVIVTDHYMFEEGSSRKSNEHLIDLVYRRWNNCHAHNLPHLKLQFKRDHLQNKIGNGHRHFEVVYFYLEAKPIDIHNIKSNESNRISYR
jgi:hypothetical protein